MAQIKLADWRYNQEVGFGPETAPPEVWEAAQAVEHLETRLRARRDERRSEHAIPSILYHYTDIRGLHGMLSSYKMWLSDAAFMNDPLEGSWVHHRAKAIASGKLEMSPLTAQIQRQIEAQLAAPDFWDKSVRDLGDDLHYAAADNAVRPAFIASFTEERDLLSQWRGYGDGGAGVAVGFDLNELGPCSLKDGDLDEYKPAVIKVEYEQERQDAEILTTFNMVDEVYKKHLKKLPSNPFAESFFLSRLQNPVREAIYWLRWEFKSPHYKEEKEWHLVLNPFGWHWGRTTRVSKGLIVPYVEIPLPQFPAKPHNRLAIPRIVLGPSCPPSAIKGIRGLLQNVANPDIERSQLSLR